MWQALADWELPASQMLSELNLVSILVRVALALLIGGLLGVERGRKNRPAGFRTYILVCLGSALVMMTNQYVYQVFSVSDPVRLGAQVISGVGFLGAGTIMVTGRNQIRGITTAAGMWTSACCGLAIGIGFYSGALIGGLTIFIIMATLRRVDAMIQRHAKIIEFYLELDPKKPLGNFLQYLRAHQFEIVDLQMNKNKLLKDAGQCLILSVESKIKRSHDEMLETMNCAPGILYIEEL